MLARFLALAVLSSLLPSASYAQPCFEGSAIDQRSLTELRAAVEEACPCDSFDGDGLTRRDYGRCADDVLEAALAMGDVRAECRSQAVAILETATCGTSRVACARIAPASDPVFSCSIKPAASCRGQTGGTRLLAARPPGLGSTGPIRVRSPRRSVTGGYAETVCEQTHCADVVEWTAGTCFDIREEGPYEAGIRVMNLTKPSAVDGEPRELETMVWYPAPAGSGERNSDFRAVVDAPIDRTEKHPIVLFSHGSCGYARQSMFLTPWLATHGFVVVAPPHPGNTIFEIDTCGANTGNSAIERPEDMIFVLDTILAENADPDSPLSDSMDAEAVGMMGHSFGGLTTFLTTERDDRIKVAVPLAAAVPGDGAFDIPSMTIIGDVDSVVSNDRNVEAYERSARPKWLVNILNSGHYAFSDGCFPGPDCDPPVTLEQVEVYPRVRRWVLPFLKVFLQGDLAFAPFLAEEAGPSFDVDAR